LNPPFIREEEGAQIVEYGLIIAVVSLALIVALETLPTNFGTASAGFIGRIVTCLTGSTCT